MNHLFLIAAFCLCLTACRNEMSKRIVTPTGTWELVWNDEFDYEGLPDSTKWSYDQRGNSYGWGNNEEQFYTYADSTNAWVAGGILSITAKKQVIEDKEYTSARLITKGKGDWLYGRFEVRAKLPTGRGTWPAIWMLPTDMEYGKWPSSGEIDIMENVGYDPDVIIASAHTETYNHRIKTQKNAQIECKEPYADFHTYTLEWEPQEYRVYYDDNLYFTYVNENSGYKAWPFDKRFYLLLNLAIGGDWGGHDGIDGELFPHHFEIDYVRVYRKVKEPS